ncbi:hypothetical protein WDB89_02935 [Pseudoalteromonas sp. B5MOD-1]|uniref:hypothetical protein n=1 Tax=Pseudoalteromonas sp. P80D2 TaxID=3113903 RepID=UPI002FC785E7
MSNKDNDLVNFSESYELNRHLRNSEFRQTEENRKQLIQVGKEAKETLNKSRLTHKELDDALKKSKIKFEKKKK